MKHIIRSTTCALVAGMLAAGCSTTPSASDVAAANTAISNAGQAIDHAASNPHVAKYATTELDRAKDSLQKAQKTWNDKHDLQATTHLAYMAQQRAATAQELANGRAAEEALQVAAAERDHAVSVAMANRHARPAAPGAPTASTAGQAEQAFAGFASGKANLPANATHTIDALAVMLKNNPGRSVVIEGHTDNVGSPAYNKSLGEERAEAVRAALLRQGIDPGRIAVRSAGEENPVASNDTSAGRRENRRADVIIGGTESSVGGRGTTAGTASGQNGQ